MSAIVGLLMLCWIFLPIYYRNNCTTTTELLERKYGKGVRDELKLVKTLDSPAVKQFPFCD